MFCGKCGSHIADGSIGCPVCGTQVAASGFTRASDLTVDMPPQKEAPRASAACPVSSASYPPPAATPAAYPPPAAISSSSEPTIRIGEAGFCDGCGTPLQTGYRFCLACGKPVASEAAPVAYEPVAETPTKPPKKKGKALVFVLLGVAVLLVAAAVALILYLVLGARTPEILAEDYFEAVLEPDAGAVLEMLPAEVSEDVLEAAGYDADEQDDFCSKKTQEMDEMLDGFNLLWGPGWTYEIKSLQAQARDEETMETLREQYAREYDFEIEDAMVVNVDVYFKGQLFSDTQTEKVYLIQVDEEWYLDYLSGPNLFHS